MLDVTQDSFKSEILDFSGLVIVDFYADWCGPCKTLKPILYSLSEKYDSVKFAKIDVMTNQGLVKEYSVSSIPTMIAFYNGNVVDMKTGFSGKVDVDSFIGKNAK